MINKKLFLTSLIALSLLGIGTIETHAQTLQDHHKLEQQKAAERQRVERQNYERACQNGTLEAYKEYLKMYPNGKFVSDINNRIADYDLWSKAKAANTIDAYSNYIRNSRFKSYIDEAKEAIAELQSIAVWQTVRSSDNIKEVESFIQEFPESYLVPVSL